MRLKNKHILVGVTGSIAAYKAALLTRLLVKEGAEVKVIMTPSAVSFITPLTLATLSKNEVYTEYYEHETGKWHNHVELALWADAMVIAPATANTIAKMAAGMCDNLLMATWLSARSEVFVAPAMDLDMYTHYSFKKNLAFLEENRVKVIDAGTGELASGLEGKGRMAEPEEIVEVLLTHFTQTLDFKGKKVLVNAGPTYEHIDPVRFVGNHSSGKMGIAIADEFANRGAEVMLVLGPTSQRTANHSVNTIHVVTAHEMYKACTHNYANCDIAVLSAAVADYKPEKKSDQKIKKSTNELTIKFVKTDDILASLGKMKKKGQILIGFALETQNERENALKKLHAKNLDAIVLNSHNAANKGFGVDTNKIEIISSKEKSFAFETKSKKLVARDIVDYIHTLIK